MKKIVIIVVFTLIVFFGCATWEKDVVKNDIYFTKFRITNNGWIEGVLAQDQIIQNYPCQKGYIWLTPNWKISEFRLSEDFSFNNTVLPKGTWLRFGEDSDVCFLPHDVEIQGYMCKGGFMQREGSMTTFYKNGQLKFFCNREDVEVDGVLCKGGFFSCVSLHENNNLKSAKLAEDTMINGTLINKNTNIKLDDKGRLIEDK